MNSSRRKWLKNIDYIKKSKAFLFPMLETSLMHQNDNVNYLIDVSFMHVGFPQIVLIFDNVDDVCLQEDIHRLSMKHCYVDSEYADDDKEVCMFFDVPKEFKKDFELFTRGKYSKFSDKYKTLLCNIYGTKREKGISPKTGLPNVNIFDVIYPTNELRKLMGKQLNVNWKLIDEVLDPPNIELEQFKTIEELYEEHKQQHIE